MTYGLRACPALVEGFSSAPYTISGGLPTAPGAGDCMLSGFLRHLHTRGTH